MNDTLRQVRILYGVFVMTWFLFVVAAKLFLPSSTEAANLPSLFPGVLGAFVVSEIGLSLFLRTRFITGAEAALRVNPEDQSAIAKWRTGNLLSFCFAETVTLFGLVLKALGFGWRVAAMFFAVGLLLLLLWAPRKTQNLPRGVR